MKQPLGIAIADDERDMREYLQEALPRLGHRVVAVAETGRQLADQCRSAAPDLIITDIKMPDSDGIDAAEEINRERPTPILLVSAHHDAELLERAAGEHIMGYLVKPISEPDLKAAIAVSMMRFQHFQALARETADLRQALADRKLIEKAKGILMKRMGVSEEEAFRRMRKLATDKNLKLSEVARKTIASDEIFSQFDKV